MKMFALILLISSPVFAETTFKLTGLPEITYLHRKIDVHTRTDKEIEAAQLLAHAAVEEIVAEAKRYDLTFPPERFFHIDMKENKILSVCLEVSGETLKSVPPEKLRKREAGKYLSIEYTGDPLKATFGKEITPWLKARQLKVKRWEAYQYKKSAIPLGMTKVFYLPIGKR